MCAGVQSKKQGRIPMSTTNLCGPAWPAAHTWGRGKVFPSATPIPQQQHLSASISYRPAKCVHAWITLSLRRQGCTQPPRKTFRLVLQPKSDGVWVSRPAPMRQRAHTIISSRPRSQEQFYKGKHLKAQYCAAQPLDTSPLSCLLLNHPCSPGQLLHGSTSSSVMPLNNLSPEHPVP